MDSPGAPPDPHLPPVGEWLQHTRGKHRRQWRGCGRHTRWVQVGPPGEVGRKTVVRPRQVQALSVWQGLSLSKPKCILGPFFI